jgi:hypothetical protein
MLTKKENYLMTLRGEQPEYIPHFTFGGMPGDTEPPTNWVMEPPLLSPHRPFPVAADKDMWGVPYEGTSSASGATLPAPNHFILPLEGLTHWQDYIKAPDFSDVDWEREVKKHFELFGVDRTQSAVSLALHFGYFQTLMSFLGFENGLIALYEYPDEVHELLHYMSDWYMDIADKVIDLYKPDALHFFDDTAAQGASFISHDTYRDFFLPHHEKYASRGRERGLLMTMHNCGRCENVLDLITGMGITGWDPAQTCNDLPSIQKEYGNRLVLSGGWDGNGRLLEPFKSPENPDGVTEEELRQSVRDTMDAYAPGGGYIWLGMFLEAEGDELSRRKNAIIADEAKTYGNNFYKTH